MKSTQRHQQATAADDVRLEYNRLAAFYDRRWQRYIDATLRIVEEVIDCRGNERLLDAPCGTGELEQRLLRRWPALQIVGIDISPEMLRQATAKRMSENVTWVQADVHSIPLDPHSCDWVICANSFHYFREPSRVLREFQRVLRSDGQLVLVDWCDDYLFCKLCSWWLRWRDPAFYRTYSSKSCRQLLQGAGFQVEQQRRFRVGRVWGLMRFVCRPCCS